MGSVGDSYDNALMENFWSTLKIELVYRKSWRTRDEAENAIDIDGSKDALSIEHLLDIARSRLPQMIRQILRGC
jgi:putative transposase